MSSAVRSGVPTDALPGTGGLGWLELACAEALASTLGERVLTRPLAFAVHWTGAAAVGQLVAEAEVVQVAADMACVEGVLLDEAGTTCARATASYRVVRP